VSEMKANIFFIQEIVYKYRVILYKVRNRSFKRLLSNRLLSNRLPLSLPPH